MQLQKECNFFHNFMANYLAHYIRSFHLNMLKINDHVSLHICFIESVTCIIWHRGLYIYVNMVFKLAHVCILFSCLYIASMYTVYIIL